MKYVDNKIVYEVGDWVTAIESSSSGGFKEGSSYQVSLINTNTLGFNQDSSGDKNGWGICNFRPATQKEINTALKEYRRPAIKIGEHIVAFTFTSDGCQHIKVGCQKVTKEEFLKVGKEARWL